LGNTALQPVAAVSDQTSPAGTTNVHGIVPGYTFTPGFDLTKSFVQPLYRVVITTDSQCVNVVFRGSIVGSPPYSPPFRGPFLLPAPGKQTIAVSEFMTSVAGSSTTEFVELQNTGKAPVDIGNWKLVYRTASGTTDIVLGTIPKGTTLPAGAPYLFGGSSYAGSGDA